MEVISIDISGKFAHFRKFYVNNTALSYSIPPRTTIMGMLASIQGKDRDSYYNEMASDKIRIGVRILCPIKKSFHRVNLLSIKNVNDFRGKSGRTQVPFEVVSGLNPKTDFVKYRIYISYYKEGKPQFEALKKVLQARDFTYNLTLGTANFSASVEAVNIHQASEKDVNSKDVLMLHSAVCTDNVNELKIAPDSKLLIEEELLPSDFMDNNDRELSKIQRVVYSIDNQPIPVILKSKYYVLSELEQAENITFIE